MDISRREFLSVIAMLTAALAAPEVVKAEARIRMVVHGETLVMREGYVEEETLIMNEGINT